jgi:hypothetical protein
MSPGRDPSDVPPPVIILKPARAWTDMAEEDMRQSSTLLGTPAGLVAAHWALRGSALLPLEGLEDAILSMGEGELLATRRIAQRVRRRAIAFQCMVAGAALVATAFLFVFPVLMRAHAWPFH